MDLTVLKFIPIKGRVTCLSAIDDLVYVGTNRSHFTIYDRKWNIVSTSITNKGGWVYEIIKYNDSIYLATDYEIESIDGYILCTLENTCSIKSATVHNNLLFVLTYGGSFYIIDINGKVIKKNHNVYSICRSNMIFMNGKFCYLYNDGNMYYVDMEGNYITHKLFDNRVINSYIIEHQKYLYISIYPDDNETEPVLHILRNGEFISYVKLKQSIISMVIHNDHIICGHKGGFLSIWKEDECLMYRKVHSYDIKVMLSFNDQLWLGMDRLVLVLGEYHKHHYSGLPQMQLDKIMEWEDAVRMIPIHKDINLLFIRELLQ